MPWEVASTSEFDEWLDGLDEDDEERVEAAIEMLAEGGPGMGRPLVDSIKASRHSNMKELRPPKGNIRILFAFDPRRCAMLLIGGDKTNKWDRWYKDMVPVADEIYDDHLSRLGKKGGQQS